VDRDDVEAIGIESADTDGTPVGYGRNVAEVLFEGEGLPA
jgi:hypothetical protein